MTTLASIPSPGFSKFQIGPFTIRMYAVCILIGVCFIRFVRFGEFGVIGIRFVGLGELGAR